MKIYITIFDYEHGVAVEAFQYKKDAYLAISYQDNLPLEFGNAVVAGDFKTADELKDQFYDGSDSYAWVVETQLQ
jgi:hypothetical protein